MSTFGERIKDLRKEKNLTQKEMAQALSITVSTLSHWECDYQEPSFKDLVLLATYFDVSTDYLIGMELDNVLQNTTKQKIISPLNDKAKELLDIFNSLDFGSRTQILEYANYIAMRFGVGTKNM